MRNSTCCAVAALMAISATTAHAQTRNEDTHLGTIQLDGDHADSADIVIDQETIENRAPQDAGDLFVGESSVTVSTPNPGAQRIFVNGIEETRLNVQVDGARMPQGPFHHAGGFMLDTALLKQVTVKPGVAAADDGPRALAGSIQFETLDARDLLTDGQKFGGWATLGYRDNGSTLTSGLTLFGREGGFEYLLSVRGENGDNFEDGDGVEMLGTEAGQTSYLAKMAYTTQDGKRYEFSANRNEENAERPSPRPEWRAVSGRDPVVAPSRYTRDTYVFSYVDETPDGWFSPEIELSYTDVTFDASTSLDDTSSTSLNGKIQNVFALSNGTVTTGLDFFRDEAIRSRYDEVTPGNFVQQSGSPFTETSRNVGIFVQARQEISSAFRISYGGRYDYQTIEGNNGQETSTSGLSGNAFVEYDFNENRTLDAGISSVFGGIASTEAIFMSSTIDIDYAALQPSRAENARLGLSYANGAWSAGGALFYTKLKDVSSLRGSNASRSNYFDFESQGVDFNVAYSTQRTRVGLNYTYSDVTRDGETSLINHYLGTPIGHMFGLNATHQINDQWLVGGYAT